MFYAIRYGGIGMGNVWKCNTCGKINPAYVGTCGCGGLKENGILISEEDLKKEMRSDKRQWQCPDCLKINELGICTCGHVKTNTYKFGLIKSICDQIYDLYEQGTGYFLSYGKLFSKFAENYWNLVNKYHLKQMSYNGKSEYSKI